MLWDLQAPLKVKFCDSIWPYLLASVASRLFPCLPLAWQGRHSPREMELTVVCAPSAEELPVTGDALAVLPSASPVPTAVCGTFPLPWGGFGVSCPHRSPGRPRRAPAPPTAVQDRGSLPPPLPALPGWLRPPSVPPSWSQPSGGRSATGTAVLQAGAISSV